jgi:hypothetical protein
VLSRLCRNGDDSLLCSNQITYLFLHLLFGANSSHLSICILVRECLNVPSLSDERSEWSYLCIRLWFWCLFCFISIVLVRPHCSDDLADFLFLCQRIMIIICALHDRTFDRFQADANKAVAFYVSLWMLCKRLQRGLKILLQVPVKFFVRYYLGDMFRKNR